MSYPDRVEGLVNIYKHLNKQSQYEALTANLKYIQPMLNIYLSNEELSAWCLRQQ